MITALILSLTLAIPAPPPLSVHQADDALHRDFGPVPRNHATPPDPSLRSLTHIVYGYLPYWISDTSSFRWQDLTHLGWFSVEVNADGTLGNLRGWPDTATVQTAHAAGVHVELVFTLFGSTDIESLLSVEQQRNTLVDNMIDQMEAGGADGINIDFEFVPSGARSTFVLFLQRLRSQLDARGHTAATISFAGPTSVSDGLDFPAIFDILDYYFVMAYGYHWSGSTYAGPVGKFRVSQSWASAGSLSLLRSIAAIADAVGEDYRHKIIAGLPYYGREWTTGSTSWPVQAISHIGSVTYSAAQTLISEGKTRYWDDSICNPVLIWDESGTTHQAWYDDAESLACKYQLAIEQKIGGVGYWALGYDNGHSELWDLIEEYFTAPTIFDPGYVDTPIPIPSFPYSDSRDTSQEGFRYFNYYSCNDTIPEYGREFVYRFDVCFAGTFTAHVNDEPTVDPDLHLLSALSEEACIDRAHIDLSTHIDPGRYFVVVDTYVDSPVELEGLYTVDMDFTQDNPQAACPQNSSCSEGTCVCDNGWSMCPSGCKDTETDPLNCGECGNTCENGCAAGSCISDVIPDGGIDSGTDSGTDSGADSGPDSGTGDTPGCSTTYSCACRAAQHTGDLPWPLLFMLLMGGLALRFRN